MTDRQTGDVDLLLHDALALVGFGTDCSHGRSLPPPSSGALSTAPLSSLTAIMLAYYLLRIAVYLVVSCADNIPQ